MPLPAIIGWLAVPTLGMAAYVAGEIHDRRLVRETLEGYTADPDIGPDTMAAFAVRHGPAFRRTVERYQNEEQSLAGIRLRPPGTELFPESWMDAVLGEPHTRVHGVERPSPYPGELPSYRSGRQLAADIRNIRVFNAWAGGSQPIDAEYFAAVGEDITDGFHDLTPIPAEALRRPGTGMSDMLLRGGVRNIARYGRSYIDSSGRSRPQRRIVGFNYVGFPLYSTRPPRPYPRPPTTDEFIEQAEQAEQFAQSLIAISSWPPTY